MAAYFIVNVEVTDPERYAEYIRAAPPTIAKYGGGCLVRGGTTQKRARQWWASEEYRAAKALRQATSVTDMILVQGV